MIEVKENAGLKGQYKVTKAKLEKPEHFELNNKIEVRKKRNEVLMSKMLEAANRFKKAGNLFTLVWYVVKHRYLRRASQKAQAETLKMIRVLNGMCKTEVQYYDNLVPTVCRTMIANNLTDATPTNTMLITHAALGSSGTAPANGDTTLGTETYRNAIASLTNASNVAYATAFYTATEVSGTFAEAGIFSDGTGTVDTGILDSHVLISVTKSTSETLTIDWEVTIS